MSAIFDMTTTGQPSSHSMPVVQAMAWAFYRHGWMNFAGALLVLCGVPAMLYGMLWILDPQVSGALREDPANLKWIFLMMELTVFPVMVLLEAGRVRPLYPLPMSTRTITNLQLALAVVTVCALHLVTLISFRVLFQAPIPIMGPLLFLVPLTVLAAGAMALWMDFRWWRPWMLLGGLSFLAWSRLNEAALRSREWFIPTPGELAVLTILALAGYWAALHGVAKDRCGELQKWPDLEAMLKDLDNRLRQPSARTALVDSSVSPARAQFWFEWASRGIALPICVLGLSLLLAVPAFLNATEFFAGMVTAVPALLVILGGAAGFVCGAVHASDSDWRLDPFRATRPLTDTQLAYSCLRAGVAGSVASVLVATGASLIMMGTSLLYRPINILEVVHALHHSYAPQEGSAAASVAWIRYGLAVLSGLAVGWCCWE